MNKRSSNTTYDRLMRQAIATGRAGTHTGRGNTASSDNALSFMGWANLLIDREGDDANPPPTGRSRRMRISRKGTGTRAPAKSVGNYVTQEPSPRAEEARPVLRLVIDNGRQRGAQRSTSAAPCLKLIDGGKC